MTHAVTHQNYRQQAILDDLRASGGAGRITDIARALAVSQETVRRNIKHLAEIGMVEKLHGGARLLAPVDEADLRQRIGENPQPKARIARRVAALIPDGASCFLDIGSTTIYVAEALKNHSGLLVATNSIAVAHKLAMRNDNRIFMAGGELRAHDGGVFGADAMDFAARFQTDFAILSATAVSATSGLMLNDMEEAKFARLILQNAARRIVTADARKFARTAPICAAPLSLIDVLVTDQPPPADIRTAARTHGVEILIADPSR
jgi:DeoR family transcriptional regulator, glycerol-3-phosphate regulon repressor